MQKDHLIEFASFNYLSTKQYPSYRERTFFFICLPIDFEWIFFSNTNLYLMRLSFSNEYYGAVLPKDDDPPPPFALTFLPKNLFINRSKIHTVLSFLQKDKLIHVLDIDRIFYKYIKTLLIAANWMLNIVTIYYIYRGRGNKILFDFFLFLQYIALPLHQKNYICLNWYTTVNESVSKKYGTVKNCRVSRDCWLYV